MGNGTRKQCRERTSPCWRGGLRFGNARRVKLRGQSLSGRFGRGAEVSQPWSLTDLQQQMVKRRKSEARGSGEPGDNGEAARARADNNMRSRKKRRQRRECNADGMQWLIWESDMADRQHAAAAAAEDAFDERLLPSHGDDGGDGRGAVGVKASRPASLSLLDPTRLAQSSLLTTTSRIDGRLWQPNLQESGIITQQRRKLDGHRDWPGADQRARAAFDNGRHNRLGAAIALRYQCLVLSDLLLHLTSCLLLLRHPVAVTTRSSSSRYANMLHDDSKGSAAVQRVCPNTAPSAAVDALYLQRRLYLTCALIHAANYPTGPSPAQDAAASAAACSHRTVQQVGPMPSASPREGDAAQRRPRDITSHVGHMSYACVTHHCGGAAACQTTNKRHPSNREPTVSARETRVQKLQMQNNGFKRCSFACDKPHLNLDSTEKTLPRYNDTVWRHREKGSTARTLRLPAVQISAGANVRFSYRARASPYMKEGRSAHQFRLGLLHLDIGQRIALDKRGSTRHPQSRRAFQTGPSRSPVEREGLSLKLRLGSPHFSRQRQKTMRHLQLPSTFILAQHEMLLRGTWEQGLVEFIISLNRETSRLLLPSSSLDSCKMTDQPHLVPGWRGPPQPPASAVQFYSPED
ncbi:hypothetical protein M409DRAFT_56065 [Zasmidium cellare ATCC 36951]|uniref:Uncharacterized protein n=1 Tax=Zasmidium cellare ATCC 36951 TaxID=1080233 RepID=A0A6A6CDA0_ZASCE|nr:uncharacterized protein M409DRAFT_56065 [Zasmidium cellare ATCC 36951]KAF2165187.1 hypothetical protein M409DRAFT_56065 [Zasmidium cellare ATCC 36951]